MQVKLSELNDAQPALQALANTKLPAKLAYRIGKALNKVSSALKSVEDYRINLLNKMAKLNDSKTKYEFDPPEQEQDFNRLFEAHKESSVEMQFPLFNLDELGNMQFEPAVMGMLAKVGAVNELEVVKTPEKA